MNVLSTFLEISTPLTDTIHSHYTNAKDVCELAVYSFGTNLFRP